MQNDLKKYRIQMVKYSFFTLILIGVTLFVATTVNASNSFRVFDKKISLNFISNTSNLNAIATDTVKKKATVAKQGVKTSSTSATKKPGKTNTAVTDTSKNKGVPEIKLNPLSRPNPYRTEDLIAGIKLAENGDLKGALEKFEICLKKNPKNYQASFYKAKALYELDDKAGGFENISIAIANSINQPLFYYVRGTMYYDAGNMDSAYKDFDKSATLNPRFADAVNFRGVIKELRGQHEDALADFNSAIDINPYFAIAYYNKGNAEASLTKFADAEQSFSKCIEYDAKNMQAFVNRGNSRVMLEKYDEAITDYTAVLNASPNNADAYYNRGVALNLKGGQNPCSDWNQAQKLGHKGAVEMINLYCK